MIVGEAHVIVRAITTGVRRDIQRAFDGIDDIGRDVGRNLGRGLSRGMGGGGGRSFFQNLAEQSDAARAQFDSLIRTTYLLGPAIFGLLGALSSLIGAFSGLALAVAGAVPSLIALPGIFAAVGAAAVTLKLAFQGVGQAISAGTKAMSGAGGGARAAERDLTNLYRRLEDARERYVRVMDESARVIADAEEKVADAIIAYNEQVAESERELADLRAEQAESERDNLEDIADAQRRLQEVEERSAQAVQDAKNRVTRAQLELNAAYEEGREQIQQLNFASENAVIAEKRAALELEKAREKLLRVQDLPPNDRARKEAELAFAQADLNYRKAMDTNADTAKEKERLDREGVEGTEAVSRARDNLASAEEARARAEIAAVRDVEDARLRLRRAERDAAEEKAKYIEEVRRAEEQAEKDRLAAQEKIADAEEALIETIIKRLDAEYDAELALKRAEEDLEKARKQSNAAGAGGANAYQNALKDLSAEQQEFVKFMVDEFVPAIDTLRDAAAKEFFPKLIPAMRQIKDELFPALRPLLRETGSVLGDIAQDFSDTLTSPQFLSSLKNIWDNINANILPGLGEVGTNLITVISRTLEAAEPVINRFVDWLKTITGGWADNLSGEGALDGLTDLFNTSADIAGQIGDLFGNVFGGLGNLIGNQMLEESGGRNLLDYFIEATAKFKEFTETDGGRITEFFQNVTENAKPILSFIGDLVKEFLKLGENPQIQGFFEKLIEYDIGTLIREIGDTFLAAGPQISEFVKNFLEFTKATLESEGVQAFFATFSKIFEGLVAFFETPAVKAVAPAIAAMAAAGVVLRTAFTLLKIPILGLINPFTKLGSKIGEKRGAAKELKAFGIGLTRLQRFLILPLSTFGLITAAIAGAVAAFVAMYRESEIFREAIKKLVDGVLQKVVDIFNDLKQRLNDALEPLGGTTGAVDKLKAAFKFLGDILGQYVVPFFEATLKNALDIIGEVLGTVIDLIGGLIETFTNIAAKLGEGDIGGAVKELLVGIFIRPFQTIMNNLFNLVQKILGNVKEAVVDALGGTFIGDIVTGVIDGISGLLQAFQDVWNAILDWIKSFLGISSPSKVFQDIGDNIVEGLRIALEFLLDVFLAPFEAAWNAVDGFITNTVLPFFSGLPDKVKTLLKLLFPLHTLLIENWDKVSAYINETALPFIKGLPAKFVERLTEVWDALSDKLVEVWGTVKSKFETYIGNVRGFVGRFKTALSSIWSPIINGLQTAWTRAKAWWNANVAGKGFEFGVGSAKVGFTVPRLAEGGIIPATSGGMLALVGEGGRNERVEPLDAQGLSRRDRALIDYLSKDKARGAEGVTINVYANPGMDETEIANIVSRQISFMMRKGSV